MTNKRIWLAILAMGLVGAALAAPSMWALVPGSGAISGWAVVSEADRKVTAGAGFYSLYDGAAPDMVAAGIVAAGQRLYRKDSRRLTVDLFRFKTAAQAKAYYLKRQGEIRQVTSYHTLAGVRHAACSASPCRSSVGYLWSYEYCASLAVNGGTAADRETLAAFVKQIAGKVAASQPRR